MWEYMRERYSFAIWAKLGQEGWELVGVVEEFNHYSYGYFKRPMRSPCEQL